MSSLTERIAARKAAEEAAKNAAPAPAPTPVPATAAAPVAEAAPQVASNKPMTFAEKLAAKRAAEQHIPIPQVAAPAQEAAPEKVSPIAASEPAVDTSKMSFSEKLALKNAAIKAAQSGAVAQEAAKATREFQIDPERLPEDPEVAQAFVDISRRIFELEDLIDDDLANAMTSLKDALRKNPSACELLLDEDVGKMTAGLRRKCHLDRVSSKENKKPGAKTKPKAKEVALTPEQLEAAWDEL